MTNRDKTAVRDVPEMVTRVDYQFVAKTFEEARENLFYVIRNVKWLADSLIGETPSCAEKLGLDMSLHADVRALWDQGCIEEFGLYLLETICGHENMPMVACGEDMLMYQTHSGRAEVDIVRRADGHWVVSGFALFCSPWRFLKRLQGRGAQFVGVRKEVNNTAA